MKDSLTLTYDGSLGESASRICIHKYFSATSSFADVYEDEYHSLRIFNVHYQALIPHGQTLHINFLAPLKEAESICARALLRRERKVVQRRHSKGWKS